MGNKDVGYWPNAFCSDCGKLGCDVRYWGALIPSGRCGQFCTECFRKREKDRRKPPKPLGSELMGFYSREVYEGIRSSGKVLAEENFLVRCITAFPPIPEWRPCEACVVSGRGGPYLLCHGHVRKERFALWIEGPYSGEVALEREVAVVMDGEPALFMEERDDIVISSEHHLGPLFRKLLEEGTGGGKMFAAATKLIV